MDTITLSKSITVREIIAKLNITIPKEDVIDVVMFDSCMDCLTSTVDIFLSGSQHHTYIDIHVHELSTSLSFLLLYNEQKATAKYMLDKLNTPHQVMCMYYIFAERWIRLGLKTDCREELLTLAQV